MVSQTRTGSVRVALKSCLEEWVYLGSGLGLAEDHDHDLCAEWEGQQGRRSSWTGACDEGAKRV